MTAEEREVLDLYRQLTDRHRRGVLATLRGMVMLEEAEAARLRGRAFEVVEGGPEGPGTE